jgi:hypothetical protein
MEYRDGKEGGRDRVSEREDGGDGTPFSLSDKVTS